MRIRIRAEATVRGVDADGKRFELRALVKNVGGGGIYLYVARPAIAHSSVLILLTFGATLTGSTGPAVAIRGTVLRVEPQADGSIGLAVALRRYRFL